MAYCPSCGKEVQPGVAFCANCGYRLVASDSTQVAPGLPMVSTAAYVKAYKTPIFVAAVLISIVFIGIGVGVYAIPGRDQANVYCGSTFGIYAQLCDQGRSLIVDGVALALVGLIILVFAGFWYARKTPP